MSLKRKIPITTLKQLEKALEGEMDKFKLVETSSTSFKIVERDHRHDSHFSFVEMIKNVEKVKYKLEIYPYDDYLKKGSPTVNDTQIPGLLSSWIQRVKILNFPSFLFEEDPIIKTYMEEQAEVFFSDNDEELDSDYLSINDQVRLKSIYDEIIEELLDEEPKRSNINFELLLDQVKESRDSIGSENRKQTRARTNKVLAFARRYKLEIFQKIIVKIIADGTIKIISKAGSAIEWIANYNL